MSSRGDDPEAFLGRARQQRWRPEPEVGPASGGHLAPDVHSAGPLFEDGDLPPRATRERTQAMPPVEGERQGRGGAPRTRRRRAPVRRVKRTLRHVDPVSVFKLSLFLYGIGVIVWLIFVGFLYTIVDRTGIFDRIEQLSRDLTLEPVEISLWAVEKWALVIGIVFWILMSLVNLLISFLYNVGADTIGGVEMTFVERDN